MLPKRKKKKSREIRFTVCKGCDSQIDDMGCGMSCQYDTNSFGDRDPATMQVEVYVLDRIEPYKDP